jgi:hypothetical protein
MYKNHGFQENHNKLGVRGLWLVGAILSNNFIHDYNVVFNTHTYMCRYIIPW